MFLNNLSNFIKSSEVLGVKVDSLKKKEVFTNILENLEFDDSLKKIFTINPEFVVDSYFDKNFFKLLNSGDFNSCDGIGLVIVLELKELLHKNTLLKSLQILLKKYFSKELSKNRLTGVEIVEGILKYAEKNDKSVYFLGGSSEKKISEKMFSYCSINFPNLKKIGGSSSFSYQQSDDNKTIKHLHQFMKVNHLSKIDFLLVGYGHKKQEFWIDRNQSKIPAQVCVGVGGTFDFLTGEVKRAPKVIRDYGLEWLFRLLVQPSRVFRIFKATFIFLFLILRSKYFSKK